MQFVSLSATEASVRRFIEELWLSYERTLEQTVKRFALNDDDELIDAEVEFRLDRLTEPEYELLVVLDTDDPVESIASTDAELVGFISTEIEDSPAVFDTPDSLRIGDFFVTEPFRGSGLATELVAWAVDRADREDCPELSLEVDIDNERAKAFYDRLGFETVKQTRAVSRATVEARME